MNTFVRTEAIGDYICGNDLSEDSSVREMYLERLEKGFRADQAVTAREYEFRQSGCELGAQYDLVTIVKLDGFDKVSFELRNIQTYMKDIQVDVRKIAKLKFETSRVR